MTEMLRDGIYAAGYNDQDQQTDLEVMLDMQWDWSEKINATWPKQPSAQPMII